MSVIDVIPFRSQAAKAWVRGVVRTNALLSWMGIVSGLVVYKEK